MGRPRAQGTRRPDRDPHADGSTATAFGQFLGSEAQLRQIVRPLARVPGASLSTGTSGYLALQRRWAGCADGGLAACHATGARRSPRRRSTSPARSPPPAGARSSTPPRRGDADPDAYGGAISRVAPGATAFVHRNVRFSVQILSYAAIPAARSRVRRARRRIAPYGNGQAYQNYADPDLDGALRAYYGANLARPRDQDRSRSGEPLPACPGDPRVNRAHAPSATANVLCALRCERSRRGVRRVWGRRGPGLARDIRARPHLAAGIHTARGQGPCWAVRLTGSPLLNRPGAFCEAGRHARRAGGAAQHSGLLDVTLRAEPATVSIGGRECHVLAYNGSFPGPTLVAHPGDTIRIRLVNGLDAHTNLHTHGLHVSGEGNADNVMIHVHPGEDFLYELELPADHAPGRTGTTRTSTATARNRSSPAWPAC